ncbi:MAG: helix-turn-helix domain-containing protein [Myxococcota bacterium]|nr:helix-turn-helix domain-containing protein [Myxococcota bacterium]
MGIPNSTEDLLNPRQAARLLGVHAASVKRWSDQGRLRCIRTAGGHRRFLRRDVEALRTPPSARHPRFVEQLWAAASAGEQMTTEGMLLDYWGQMGR